MKKIKLTKGQYALVDDEDFERLNSHAWYASFQSSNGKYFAESHTCGRELASPTRKMHRILTNAPQGMEVDHINGNSLDNRKSNLRVCSKSENMRNRDTPVHNKCGYKGVHRNGKRWRARITVNGVIIELGYHDSPEDAARAYNLVAPKYHGEFAKLNIIKESK